MNGITRNQWLGIIAVVLNAIVVSTAFLTDTFGASVAKEIVGSAAFLNMILGGVATLLSGQGQQIKDVVAMPGVERITVNTQANQTLATMAVDPLQGKVAPKEHQVEEVTQIAKGN